jgi:hypothetical protein
MPNFDGGHYFLTVLAPIRTGAFKDEGRVHTHLHALRETLDLLPTARQMPVNEDSRLDSPFARNTRTHFARFAVIDNVIYNGRISMNAIRAAFAGAKALAAQKADRLSRPYLFFAVDFDAASADDQELERYLTELWDTMPAELVAIFSHCEGFAPGDARSFVSYIKRCQIETTMPFNDYWTGKIPLEAVKPGELGIALPLGVIGALALVGAILAFIGALIQALGLSEVGGWAWAWITLACLAVAVAGLGAALYLAHQRALGLGSRPFPAAPNSDLKSVLKAIYLQQRFVDFAIKMQPAEPAALHEAFRAFLAEHKPGEPEPTQAPGVIR